MAETTVTLTDDDREMLADALENLHDSAPARRAEVVAFAERAGLPVSVDG